MTVTLSGVQIENLRGFRSTLLGLEQSVVLPAQGWVTSDQLLRSC